MMDPDQFEEKARDWWKLRSEEKRWLLRSAGVVAVFLVLMFAVRGCAA